ncbi:hypothetical protein [Agriterribacter sp.]|mgnify:CR=1 FL=1|uniref:hypothetical protein n=1 Tax=Agriterribacter sp. TaxID=2821509 RepID=UPI002B6F8A29|nr:hypothetical protein [Agriterribacter sp.]HRO46183.1 hypothetical protein [Agriterribacter sp.]HRQ16297.1 hypothetical protein [Agriterribacter sp.]
MKTKQAARQEPSVFALIVDKLRYMDEVELKLAYIKLFRKELEEEWKSVTAEADFSTVTDKEIVAAIQREHYGTE